MSFLNNLVKILLVPEAQKLTTLDLLHICSTDVKHLNPTIHGFQLIFLNAPKIISWLSSKARIEVKWLKLWHRTNYVPKIEVQKTKPSHFLLCDNLVFVWFILVTIFWPRKSLWKVIRRVGKFVSLPSPGRDSELIKI